MRQICKLIARCQIVCVSSIFILFSFFFVNFNRSTHSLSTQSGFDPNQCFGDILLSFSWNGMSASVSDTAKKTKTLKYVAIVNGGQTKEFLTHAICVVVNIFNLPIQNENKTSSSFSSIFLFQGSLQVLNVWMLLIEPS